MAKDITSSLRINSSTAANVAIVITCALLSAVLLRQLFSPQRSAPPPPPYERGEIVEFRDVLPSGAPTLVLFLSSNCQFCTQSMPVYRELSSKRAGRFNLVAMSREESTALERYLSVNNLQVDRVLSTGRRPTKVTATPTLVVVEEEGRVMGSWVGVLGNRLVEVKEALHLR